jgi:hypothetical protein
MDQWLDEHGEVVDQAEFHGVQVRHYHMGQTAQLPIACAGAFALTTPPAVTTVLSGLDGQFLAVQPVNW